MKTEYEIIETYTKDTGIRFINETHKLFFQAEIKKTSNYKLFEFQFRFKELIEIIKFEILLFRK